MRAASRNKKQQLQQELDTWYDRVQQFTSQLSERYGHKPSHYMNLLFSGREINQDAEPGEAQHPLSMQNIRIDNYHALTKQEKEKLIEQLQNERQSRKFKVGHPAQ
ncbi:hypothetical protein PYCCODRAFT_1464249 [Trametes coccinea BRFM310]|uniref:Uncharacterized protein n=1 Tax=Trametes coccinea (strain BRFM310) TaxID=1353009 RepID=A0A1Y2J0E1_TRAC3|nr:hypothetical protein PYCCODRAFT_1464249 [Trametes coccinea BRFM310]